MDSTNLQSILILGRQPALGLVELESLYGATLLTHVSSQVAGLNLPTSKIDFRRLGGSTRLAQVITEIQSKLWKDVEKQLLKSVVEIANQLPEGKVQLGLSVFDIPITPAKLNATGLTLKKVLRAKTGKSVRLTPNPEVELNTAQVLHNHLTAQTGIELLIIATTDGKTLLARTTDVQDIDSYTLRDRGRPKRDARVGMLPPKLAQIIINLTNPTHGSVILDPFCGTGVLLQEAMLMGYGISGTDLDARMVDYTDQNLTWAAHTLMNMPEVERPESAQELNVGDATNHVWDPKPQIVATETYLGRPFTERPTSDMVMQTSTEVNLILKKFLKNIHSQLAPGAQLCVAVPAWQIASDQFRHLPLIDQLSNLGYNRTRFEHASDSELLYYREDQFTARELLVLTRK